MTDENAQPENKLHIDADWKAEAQAEKEKLAEAAAKDDGAEAPGPGQMPPASFETLVSTWATQAMLYMGAIPDPMTGKRMAHLDLAAHHLNLLGVLEEKTKGNLTEDEEKLIGQALHELRLIFAQVQQQLAAQAMAEGNPAASGPGPIQAP